MMMRLLLCLAPVVTIVTPAAAEPADELTEIVVREYSLRPSPGRAAYAVTTIDSTTLRASASPRLDDLLKAVPGASLFRRSSSRVAHPTTQGLSLRGIGPNGAGRTLVLLDGVPVNDPFGGWVYWSALPAADIAAVDIIRGGGAGPWGNAALAGTVMLSSEALDGTGARFDASYGTKDTVSLSGQAQAEMGAAAVFAGGHYFSSDGYHTLGPDQRGAVDQPLGSEAAAGHAGARWHIDEITSLTFKIGAFEEDRENGTPLAFNESRSYDASLRLVREAADGDGFEVTLYGTDRRFENQFSSVNDDRSDEVPALYQFNVPSEAWGATALVRQSLAFGGVIEAGADIRLLNGETNERFFFSGGEFLRERRAGGDQVLAGTFVEYTTQPLAAVRLTGGLRLDYLKNSDGERVERALDSGTILRDETFDDQDHWVVNGRFGATYQASESTTLRAAAYSGFRLPTINELYRPFRVRADITEANPELKPERLYGFDMGGEFAASPSLSFEATLFANWLNNAVANVLITDQPGFNADLGVFVPTGGSLSQRRNLDRVRALGLEAAMDWTPAPAWTLRLDYLFTDSEVTQADAQPALEGRRPPQTSRHQGSLTAAWTPEGPLSARAVLYGGSGQYDDPLNSRKIDGYAALDLFLGYRLGDKAQLYATAENLFDAEIEVGNASNGLISYGRPRLLSVGLRTAF